MCHVYMYMYMYIYFLLCRAWFKVVKAGLSWVCVAVSTRFPLALTAPPLQLVSAGTRMTLNTL